MVLQTYHRQSFIFEFSNDSVRFSGHFNGEFDPGSG